MDGVSEGDIEDGQEGGRLEVAWGEMWKFRRRMRGR